MAIREISRYLSFLLRHHPETLCLNMSEDGWVNVDELIEKINKKNNNNRLDLDTIKAIVKNNDKQRFDLKEENGKFYIRANQGHSIKYIDMEYEPCKPPKILYHGTGEKYLNSILKSGLLPKTRQYVHLSADEKTATIVGLRHGNVKIFVIDSERMYNDGVEFYLSKNGVWLTKFVDVKYMKLKED